MWRRSLPALPAGVQGELSDERRAATRARIWTVPADFLTGPFDPSRATRLTDRSPFSDRLVQDRSGAWQLPTFHNRAADGSVIGGPSDPSPVSRVGDRLVVPADAPGAVRDQPTGRAPSPRGTVDQATAARWQRLHSRLR